ncbi:MAG: glycine cleavage system protein GcvH [Acidobacteriota bacterium]|nr:glycine cleavage system protein GcvH [Acidobacteriota bacterium]
MYPSDLKYTNEHEWVRLEDGTATVGITDFAQKQLGDVVFVELPSAGTQVSQGQVFGTIESVKAVSELYAPLTGEVVEVNSGLSTHPEAVNAQPHETWMIKIKLSNDSETSALLDSDAYNKLVG